MTTVSLGIKFEMLIGYFSGIVRLAFLGLSPSDHGRVINFCFCDDSSESCDVLVLDIFSTGCRNTRCVRFFVN